MADFLTRLIERSSGLSPLVQPMIPSKFAPEQSNPAAPVFFSEPDQPPHAFPKPDGAQSPEPADDQPKKPRSDRLSALSEREEASSYTSSEPKVTITDGQINNQFGFDRSPGPASTARRPEEYKKVDPSMQADDVQAPRRETRLKTAAPGADTTGQMPFNKTEEHPEPKKQEFALRPPLQITRKIDVFENLSEEAAAPNQNTENTDFFKRAADQVLVPGVRTLASPRGSSVQDAQERPFTDIVNRPLRSENREHQETAPEAGSSARQIKVTIGRIEVRAVMQNSLPPKRSAPPAPKLSLDDYLEQRTGGKR